MLKKTKIDVLIFLISLILCEARAQHNKSSTYNKIAIDRAINCGFIDKWIFWSDCSKIIDVRTVPPTIKQPVPTPGGFRSNCSFFQRYVLWDYKSCGPEQVPPYSSTCTELEHYFMNKMKCDFNPDEFLDVPQIITRLGLNVETHQLKTEDNYILEIHRIPSRKPGAQPVLLQHGIFGSSADWVINGENSIGIFLARYGYDVWMANSRGNTYSDGHTLLPNHSPQYWNFSLDELALKDVHSVLTFITQMTHMDGQILFIGHGTGALLGLMYSTTYAAEISLIKLIVTLGPTIYPFHMESPLTELSKANKHWFDLHFGSKQFLPDNEVKELISKSCQRRNLTKIICDNFVLSIFGYSREDFNLDKLSVLLAKRPSGVSAKTVIHLMQLSKFQDKTKRYDYGSQGNVIAYGTENAQEYPIENIKVPVYIMFSLNDWFSKSTDVYVLAQILKNLDSLYKIHSNTFGHLDYLVGSMAFKLIFKPLISQLAKYPVEFENGIGNGDGNKIGKGDGNGNDKGDRNDIGHGDGNEISNGDRNGIGKGDGIGIGKGDVNGIAKGDRNGIGKGDGNEISNGDRNGTGKGDGIGIGKGDVNGIAKGDINGIGNGDRNGIGKGDGNEISNGDRKGIGKGDGNGIGKGDGYGIGNADGNGIGKGDVHGIGKGNVIGKEIGNGIGKGDDNGVVNEAPILTTNGMGVTPKTIRTTKSMWFKFITDDGEFDDLYKMMDEALDKFCDSGNVTRF